MPAQPTSVRLSSLSIEEISAVDQPANLLPGFMVCKALAKQDEAWIEQAVRKADDETIRVLVAAVEKANPTPDGKYRQHILGIPDSTTALPAAEPAEPSAAASPTSAAEKTLGLFRAAYGYRRIW